MEKDPDIVTEIKTLSPLVASLRDTNVFSVPEGYFENISNNVMDAVKISNINFDKNSIQEVPAGYFESLSSNIMQRIKEENSLGKNDMQGDGVLKSIERKNVFSVPVGYFENLSTDILNRIKDEQHKKVIPLPGRNVWKYAAAAVLAIGIFVTSYFATNNQRKNNNDFAVVNTNTVPYPAALKFNSTKAFNEGIASLSDEEIISYLEMHGNILDNDLLLKNTDGSELPDAADYLINEEALANYLDKINNKESKKQ